LSKSWLDAFSWPLFLKLLPILVYNVNVRKFVINFHSGNWT
jgi:hypothetical protein